MYKRIFKESIKPNDMMKDCENFKSSKKCLLGKYQKEYCNKDCEYYKKENIKESININSIIKKLLSGENFLSKIDVDIIKKQQYNLNADIRFTKMYNVYLLTIDKYNKRFTGKPNKDGTITIIKGV